MPFIASQTNLFPSRSEPRSRSQTGMEGQSNPDRLPFRLLLGL